MTSQFGLGVRYKLADASEYRVRTVTGREQQAEVLREMRSKGIEAVPVALTWQVVPDPTSGENT